MRKVVLCEGNNESAMYGGLCIYERNQDKCNENFRQRKG